MTQHSEAPNSPSLGFVPPPFDDDDKSETTTPYEPSPELFKKPTKVMVAPSDDEEYAEEDEQEDNSDDMSSENKYEEERKKKIERNKMLLANLGLANGLIPKNNGTSPSVKKARRSTGSEPTEVRRSSRLSSKPKPVYNFKEIEKENMKLMEEKKTKIKEEKKMKYYSKRTLKKRRSGEYSDSDDSEMPEYNENNKRRSSRSKKKIDYAELEENGNVSGEERVVEFEDEQVTVIEEESPKKKKKVTKKSSISSPVCSFSNFAIPDEDAIHFTEIGGIIATGTNENITHVITKVYKRTLKLMCGIIRGAYIVSNEWLFDSVTAGYFLDEKPYLIKGDGVDLVQSRKRALKLPIFSDMKFFVCDDIPSSEIVTQIIETGSGSFISDIDEMLDDDFDFENCYVIYENEETREKYPTLPNEIFKTKEFIFSAAVAQEIQDV